MIHIIRNSIPNLFTLLNLFFGFLSVMYSALGDYKNAAILILIGMMLDSMDGRIARMLNVESDLGKELDSLADIVTFGVAPAMMAYYSYFSDFGIFGMAISGLFPLFGAYRLARFNINAVKSSQHYFTGVPITAGGGLLTLLTLFHGKMPAIILPIAFFVICYLMVSTIKIPSLKDIPLPKYGIIITLFLGYAIYIVFKKEQHRFPYFIYVAIPLYVAFISYQLVRIKRSGPKK
ncbi:CDP-diacylglycerol--serine O-phosphatidyltransferase [Bacillus salipaludis]|uniref:CDP-diacylglycerol--serine O-phosphatidyltransferase n=1 Tax=Bacillus salipaludis TaxID=2547811 RepID=A0AA90TTD2_9BACI|nr:CDP-diacylglycerol--serine O-phosphatidyltransferase [Bacillus salipaludis]MDQ6597374.1 CDP-diacylglycerol--serine O-phosphatidyltransferase [Bacillus salipaludis]